MAWSTSRHPGSTRASRALRAATLRAWPICYLNYPGCTVTSTQDDHVIPLYRGGTDDPGNHRGACQHCHKIKSAAEAQEARRFKRRRTEREPHPGRIQR